MKRHFFLLLTFLLINYYSGAYAQGWQALASPEVGDKWVRPARGEAAQPVWGHAEGIRIGLAPLPGPRGLLRVYTPYLGHKEGKMMNFIAFEPIPEGTDGRGLSELERSRLDDKQGKRFWSANDSLSYEPLAEDFPASGTISTIKGEEALTVYIFSEPFESGAKVYVRLRFYENRPYEVELTTFARADSRKLKNFILTATMGNYARLRTLYLANATKHSAELWPDYTDSHFTPHANFPVKDFITDKNGKAYFIAAPDEKNPQDVVYSDNTNDHWKYYGDLATQYWYVEKPDPEIEGLVNGRFAYWSSKSPIPGGISYENFELKAPFENGAEYVFGITPVSPEEFIKGLKRK